LQIPDSIFSNSRYPDYFVIAGLDPARPGNPSLPGMFLRRLMDDGVCADISFPGYASAFPRRDAPELCM
jgi:hypothetical protein